MTRYCPNCRAVVPEHHLNCPQCYTDVPPEGWVTEAEQMRYTPTKEQYRENIEKRHKSHLIVLILALVPAFLGILGLGQIYRDRLDTVGWLFLGVGLVLDVLLAALIFVIAGSGLLSAVVLAIPTVVILLIYIGAAIASVIDAFTGSLLRLGLKH